MLIQLRGKRAEELEKRLKSIENHLKNTVSDQPFEPRTTEGRIDSGPLGRLFFSNRLEAGTSGVSDRSSNFDPTSESGVPSPKG